MGGGACGGCMVAMFICAKMNTLCTDRPVGAVSVRAKWSGHLVTVLTSTTRASACYKSTQTNRLCRDGGSERAEGGVSR